MEQREVAKPDRETCDPDGTEATASVRVVTLDIKPS